MAATGEDTGLDMPTWPSDHGASIDRASGSPIGGYRAPARLPIAQPRKAVKRGGSVTGTDPQTVKPLAS